MMQPPTGITHHRFSLFRFRSPLLTESLLFSLPAGTEMFHFPAFPPTGLYIQPAVTHHNNEQGFPIRTSSDQRPVIGSPRLIADSHVLHRLLMPRHPPCALNNLHTIKKKKNQETTQPCSSQKMLASTIQFSNNKPHHHQHQRKPPAPAPASHQIRPHLACNPKTQERTRTTQK